MSPEDKKRLMIAGALFLVAGIVLFLVIPKKRSAPPRAAEMPAGEPGAPGVPGPPPPGGMPGEMGARGVPGEVAPGGEAKPAPTQVVKRPMLPYRPDPFVVPRPPRPIRRKPTGPPPPPRFFTVPPVVASRVIGPEVSEVTGPPRRMAGVLWNDRVWAILESGEAQEAESFIVKPGDIVEGGRVQIITRDKLVLSGEGKKPRDVYLRPMERKPPPTTGPGMPGGVPGGPAL